MLKPETTDQYIEWHSGPNRERLESMRRLLNRLVPEAEEVISYAMPALRYHGILVFYAAWKTHLGFYPSGSGIREFEQELAPFKFSKGAIQFPYAMPLPVELIEKIVALRKSENLAKAALKKKKS